MSETILRLQGLKCPLPVLRTRKILQTLKSGDVVVVECTDPLAVIDIPHLVQQTGDILELSEPTDAGLTFRIRKQ
jgi:tRNA 2-thiouridine synthesizing protein A